MRGYFAQHNSVGFTASLLGVGRRTLVSWCKSKNLSAPYRGMGYSGGAIRIDHGERISAGIRSRQPKIKFNGQSLCLRDWAKKLKVDPAMLRWRLRNGWGVSLALGTPKCSRSYAGHRGAFARWRKRRY